MRQVAVGIHVDDQPERIAATVTSVQSNCAPDVEVILLLDGIDAPSPASSSGGAVRRLSSRVQLGRAAWFNRLHRATSADVVVLLEGGCLVGPDWLTRMLVALDADSGHGLAGPSTNRCWNEQGTSPHIGGDPCAIALATRDVVGEPWRTLEPLHSLNDFCWAVKREVIDAIGDADERYATGPCWEMDYNVRAARAGWLGVWTRHAFVWRAPASPRRLRDEFSRFEHAKRLYQDKFCGRRLRGERLDYEAHCRGEACEQFAPMALIEVARREHRAPVERRTTQTPTTPPAPVTATATPLVSCIMPTRDRPDFALQSVRYFLRQDYPSRELIIVDDGRPGLEQRLPDDPRIRYERVTGRQTIGAKRNRGCALARGEVLMHWDDDDWYGPRRIGNQVAPILSGDADVTGLTASLFLSLEKWEFWRCSAELHRRLFVHDVHGGTLALRRQLWDEGTRYPDVSLAEDAILLRDAVRRGARLARVDGAELFIYLRHGANSWRFECGQHIDAAGWSAVSEPARLLGGDRSFYAQRSPSARQGTVAAPDESPTELPDESPVHTPDESPPVLLTCIMPTANRRRFVPRAIEYFLRQDYSHRELIIVDDGADAVADLVPADPRIRYVALRGRHTIGAKRNIACEAARGDVIVHWDDDDWSSSSRLSLQAAALAANPGTSVCGLAELFFYEPATQRSWRYSYRGARSWVSGNTLCYRRSAWMRSSFLSVDDGEDTRFVWGAAPGTVLPMADPRFFVGVMHDTNSSAKRTAEPSWHALPPSVVPALLGHDVEYYRSVTGLGTGVDAAAAARMAPFPKARPALPNESPAPPAAVMPRARPAARGATRH